MRHKFHSKMNPEKWEKAKEIFSSALESDEGQRAAFVREACGNDEEMRDEIESLLASFVKAEDFIETPVMADALKLVDDNQGEALAGRRLGQYTLIKEIGRGGMGAVYLASRADESFKKYVAIKLIKRGMDSEDILRRFRNERQILASLDHPNIAKLLDGGTTDDGLPFFVMEYIEGQPLTNYCDSHRLSTLERLKLFREICAAVQHAHQNLIVHRDLKPSNIVITPEGMPKLLDFGIAKLLNPNLSPQTMAPTATMMRMMTRDYASPEQVRGEPITTASDIYSLGVLLYRLLTGHQPYQFKTHLPQEIEQVICESTPERPSTMVARTEKINTADGVTRMITPDSVSSTRDTQPEKLRRILSGDLDNIILMAMRKEPQRRYASVAEFSEDIRRHLEGLPVIATKDTFKYRTSKFVKRHKVGVAATLFVTLALIAGVISTVWQTRIARQQRDAAEREKVKAESISLFLQGMLGSPAVSEKGRDVKVIDVIGESAKRAETELANQPEVLASVQLVLGRTYQQMGDFDAAEKQLRAALELGKKNFGEESPETAFSYFILSSVLWSKGNFAESETFSSRSLEIYKRLGQAESRAAIDSLIQLGLVYGDQGKLAEAEAVYEEALRLCRKFNVMDTVEAAATLNNLGHLSNQRGDWEKTQQYYLEAIAISRNLRDAFSQASLATNLQNLGSIYKIKGDYAAAEPLLREAFELRRRLLGEKHPHVAIVQVHIADLFYRRGEYDKAEREAKEALAIQEAALPKGNIDLARSLHALGLILTAKGEAVSAEKLLREALEIRRKYLVKGNQLISLTESALGLCLATQGRYAEAEPLLVSSYNDLKASQGERNQLTLEALRRVVKLYEDWKKPELAARFSAQLTEASK